MKNSFKILCMVLCLMGTHNHKATAAWLKIKNMSNHPVKVTSVKLAMTTDFWNMAEIDVYDLDYYITVPPGETKIVDPKKYWACVWKKVYIYNTNEDLKGKAGCGEFIAPGGVGKYFLTIHAWDDPLGNQAIFEYYLY